MNRRAATLLLTLIFMVGLIVMASAYMLLVTVGTRNVGGQENNVKAFYLAEAGLNKAVWYFLNTAPDGTTDGSWRTFEYPANPGPSPNQPKQESSGEGTYTMWVGDSGDNVLITARGEVNDIQRVVQQEISIGFSAPEAFDYVIYAGDAIDTAGASNLTITGDQLSGIDTNNFPEVDFGYYKNLAPPSQKKGGAYTFVPGTYSGVWHINGPVIINSNVTVNGTVVATGSISMSGGNSIILNPESPNPALISNDEISAVGSSGVTINGLIYSGADGDGRTNFNNSNNVNIAGTIISEGDVILTAVSNSTIIYDAGILATPPLGFSGGGSGEVVGMSSVANTWTEI